MLYRNQRYVIIPLECSPSIITIKKIRTNKVKLANFITRSATPIVAAREGKSQLCMLQLRGLPLSQLCYKNITLGNNVWFNNLKILNVNKDVKWIAFLYLNVISTSHRYTTESTVRKCSLDYVTKLYAIECKTSVERKRKRRRNCSHYYLISLGKTAAGRLSSSQERGVFRASDSCSFVFYINTSLYQSSTCLYGLRSFRVKGGSFADLM